MKQLHLGNAGWVRYQDADCPPLFLRYLPDEKGRWLLRELYLDASREAEPITRSTLPRVPLPDIEANVNRNAAAMASRLDLRSPLGNDPTGSNLAVLASHYSTTFGKDQPENWVWVAWSGKPVARKPAPRAAAPSADRNYRLQSGPVDGITGEFLQQVAAAYWAATERGESPNVAIHEQVPHYQLSTVRWWVRLARERGYLPAGRRGARG